MAESVKVKNTGLRGVTVADTKISFIDGDKGVLIYRGYRIEELAEKSSFMETAYLILNGNLPDNEQLASFINQINAARELPEYIIGSFKQYPKTAAPMDVIQAAVSLLAMDDPGIQEDTKEANIQMAMRLIARLPALVSAWHRIRQGLEPLQPDNALSHSANFLYQLNGKRPDEETVRDLDTCLILHADHTFNASTFACREVVSTRAHIYAGVSAGIGALSGSLHGGANAQVMKMLKELEYEKDVAGRVRTILDQGGKIMGMGHAVYKTMDPRAGYLKNMAARLSRKTGQERWHYLSEEIEKTALAELARRGKTGIQPNVDFYSAPVYHLMGIPGDLMTPVFAISRISGWCGHIIEEKFAEAQEKPALYRPKAEYVGEYCGLMGCEYDPLDERG